MTDWTPEAIEQRIQNRTRQSATGPAQPKTLEPLPAAVIVTDVHMSFASMVIFMIKWALASIPAMLILFLLGLLCWTAGLAFLGGGGLAKH